VNAKKKTKRSSAPKASPRAPRAPHSHSHSQSQSHAGAHHGAHAAGAAPQPRKADIVARTVLSDIVRGRFPVGSLLPKEDELATRFSVNRGVVREAVKLLEVHGLVRPVRRKGTVVLDPRLSLSPEVLFAMIVPQRGRADATMLKHFLEVRAIIDAEMAALAARRRDKTDLSALTLVLEAAQRSPDDQALFVELQRDFADALAHATHNPLFAMLAAWNRRVVAELEDVLTVALARPRENIEGLGILLNVIRRGDEGEARTLVNAYHAWLSPRIIAASVTRGSSRKA
jgi:DNA-binding FadR family transcriptional regulator